MAIKIEMLRNFVAVAELGNLNDAADRLGRTPSAVSMSLKQLEEHLGAPLFVSDRKNRLTALGRFTLAEGSREIEQFARCIDALTTFAHARIGIVRVGAVPSVTAALLPMVVKEFARDRPDVTIHIRDLDSISVLREVEMQRIDIGISASTTTMSAIKSKHLFSDRFGVLCNEDHPLVKEHRPLKWSDLKSYPLISNATGGQINHPIFREMDDAAYLRIRNTNSVLGMVRAGVGITVLPKLTIKGQAQGLCFLPLAEPNIKRHVKISSRAHEELSPVAAAFERAIIDRVSARNVRDFE